MSAQTDRAVTAAVELRLRVPRGAMGDVERGVEDVLAGVDGVDRVEVDDLRGVHPGSLDLYVDARVALALPEGPADPDRLADHLADGFGVERVETVVLEVEA